MFLIIILSLENYYIENIVLLKINMINIKGVNNIAKIYTRKEKDKWMIDTDGNNLLSLLKLNFIDKFNINSNDMWEIYKCFGIEAARKFLFNEFINIIKSGGTNINPVHINLLVDKMTYTGNIRAIARFGVETSQYEPLSRATFEEVMTQLIMSAVHSEKDNLNTISSNIIVGKNINAGTGRTILDIIPTKKKK